MLSGNFVNLGRGDFSEFGRGHFWSLSPWSFIAVRP